MDFGKKPNNDTGVLQAHIARIILLTAYTNIVHRTWRETGNLHAKMKAEIDSAMKASPTIDTFNRLTALDLPKAVRRHLQQYAPTPLQSDPHTNLVTQFATA